MDLGNMDLDEEFDETKIQVGGNAIHAIIKALKEGDTTGKPWTPRRIGLEQATGGVSGMLLASQGSSCVLTST
jgi:hypothetical protein